MIALIHSLNKEQQELVEKCLSVYSLKGEVKDVLYTNIKEIVKQHSFIATFGKIPASLIEAELTDLITKPVVINLPHPKQLVNIPENQKHRKHTADLLSQLSVAIEEAPVETSTLTITEDDLPLLDEHKTLLLQKLTENRSSIVLSKNGSLIEVGNERRNLAPIFFTIEELFLLEKVMKTFDVSEVQILRDE